MWTKSNTMPRSGKLVGTLWLVAGVLCLAPRVVSDGTSGPGLGIGIMFILFGIIWFSTRRTV